MPHQTQEEGNPQSAWAIYLRTSSEEAQNPENSQNRQRHAIQQALLERSSMPVHGEYIDNLSGLSFWNRPGFQQMLEDARAGHFSHIAVENAERFGRSDTKALVAIDTLHQLGVTVRFADYPSLDPLDADDRIVIGLSFTLARRESMKMGQRIQAGVHTRMRSGQAHGKAPDGYINCEKRVNRRDESQSGRYIRWVEPDPQQFKVWRLAWDLLLTGEYSLSAICKELHRRGYHFRSGRAFVWLMEDGKTRCATSSLSSIFRNWFYAGWVVSESANIPPKTVRGKWEPVVTTEEFERGLEILASRSHRKNRK